MHELPAGSIRLPPLTMYHFTMALQKSKPSVNQKDLQQYIEWTKSYGQDG
jgi:SpoVK/Ycf46/Vps4 family AAA+-type ATPase